MKTRGALALLIPAFNAEVFLPRLLASARSQTEPFDEIWVYDDGSVDQTAVVAEGFGARVLRGRVNKGCSAARNVLAHETQADWLHFHDADDELAPSFVSVARKWIAADEADVVLFAYEERDDATGARLGVRRFDPIDASRDARSYAIREQINPFCGLYRREALLAAGGFEEDPEILFNEDVATHISLAFAGLRFAAETDVSIINHRRSRSMSSANALKCAQAQYEVLRRTSARPGAAAYRDALASRLWRVAGVLAAHLDWATADKAAALARSLAPPARGDGSPLFRGAAAIAPGLALRLREAGVRCLRPQLRRELVS